MWEIAILAIIVYRTPRLIILIQTLALLLGWRHGKRERVPVSRLHQVVAKSWTRVGAMSNLGASVQISDSIRSALSNQAQTNYNAALNQSQAAGEQYSAGLRQLADYGSNQSYFVSSGKSHSLTESTGFNQSAHDVSQLVDTFRKEHHVSHERAAQVLAQVYTDAKIGLGFIAKGEVGASGSIATSGRSAFGSLYNDAKQFATDHNFAETVDSAKRAAIEDHYRTGTDQGSRYSDSIASSFDRWRHV